jgi:hypothetical protein
MGMSFEVTEVQLLALLVHEAALQLRDELLRLVDTWSEEYDHCEELDEEDGQVQPDAHSWRGALCAAASDRVDRGIGSGGGGGGGGGG